MKSSVVSQQKSHWRPNPILKNSSTLLSLTLLRSSYSTSTAEASGAASNAGMTDEGQDG